MKSINRREGKKIAVMAAVIMGFMVFAFMPMASAGVTDFTVTPSTGIAGAVDSYNALVTTDGVTSIDITIPAGFIAVMPTTGGVEIARVDFWNESTRDYYGYGIIMANKVNPEKEVDIHCKFGGEAANTTQPVKYNPGETNTFVSNVLGDTSSAIIKLPTEDYEGYINLTINCTAFHLDDVMIAIKQFVRNPLTKGDYVFSADGEDETVSIITAAGGRSTVFRSGAWYADTNGDHIANVYFGYGIPLDIPLIGNFGSDDIAVVRNVNGGLVWFVDKSGRGVGPYDIFGYGNAGDTPLVGDCDHDGIGDIAVVREVGDGLIWFVDKSRRGTGPYNIFGYGLSGDTPLVGDFNHDGTDDIAVVRGNIWCVDAKDDDRVADMIYCYGLGFPVDIPLVGDIGYIG
ncbi:hypothetical protein C5S29_09510 [ANME-1 cluster archaeon GoMg3.2]|nr:hypothetical protein [ANME-1 cluster archaeon GoMg3.2]